MKLRYSAAAVLALTLFACRAQPRADPESARRAIDSLQTKFEEWATAGHADSIAALYAEDGWQMPPNQPAIVGRDSIRTFWITAFKWGRWDFDLTSADVAGADSLAVERGGFALRFTAAAGSPIPSFEDRGNHLTLWRQEGDGRWRIQWYVGTSSLDHGPPVNRAAARPPAASNRVRE